MSRKWSSLFGVAALAGTLLLPAAANAQHRGRDFDHHHRSHWNFSVGVGPGPYYYGPGYATGYYDPWGVYQPYRGPYVYGYYDHWGHWHRR